MATTTGVSVLQRGFAELRRTEAFADCKIICGPYQFNVHKAVLCSQSQYFMAAFKNGTFKEGDTGVIEFKATSDDDDQTDDCCDDPEIVKLMIEYFHAFDYLRQPQPIGPGLTQKVYLVEHAKAFAIAVKYQVEGLRYLSVQKFKSVAAEKWDHKDFPHAIHIIYHSTPDDVPELRDIVAELVHDHFGTLNAKKEVKMLLRTLASLTHSILERGAIQTDLVCSHNQETTSVKQECGSCGKVYHWCRFCYITPPSDGCRKCGRSSRW